MRGRVLRACAANRGALRFRSDDAMASRGGGLGLLGRRMDHQTYETLRSCDWAISVTLAIRSGVDPSTKTGSSVLRFAAACELAQPSM